ncbi:MAG: hypothetical protein IRZ16_03840 [Myxococcaceae bacterium]|nr:hypothetical protein [Myxococcaceae bacterium]
MRGQTLVLFALTLLLLTLMVVMTIGIGARIHERQEQQIVADAAAYSQAVLTARTFNSISSMNRVLVAQMASIAAAQSLLSWAGFYHGVLNQARDVLTALESQRCGGVDWSDAKAKICYEDNRLIEIFEPPGSYEGIEGRDVLSADYIRRDLYRTALLIAEHQRLLYDNMMDEIVPAKGPTLAQRIADGVRRGSPWRSSPQELYSTGQRITQRELEDVVARDAQGRPRQTHPRDMVQVTMATRGVEAFPSSREWTRETDAMSAARFVERRINKVIDPTPLTIQISHYGTSYFSDEGPRRGVGTAETEGLDGQPLNRPLWNRYYDRIHDAPEKWRPTGAWAQDSGTFTFVAPPGCKVSQPTEDAFGYLVSTHRDDNRDNHMWRRGQDFDYREWGTSSRGTTPRQYWPDRRHTFVDDPDSGGVNIWPAFVDYNAANLNTNRPRANVWGQPKSLVNIQRNYAARTTQDPWELRLRFNFSRDGQPGTLFDMRDERPGLRRATAIAAGLTYYHRGPAGPGRKDHSREPPNFLNPFWRATLVASDVDERYADRGTDVMRTLRRDLNEPDQARALDLLLREGFEAVP